MHNHQPRKRFGQHFLHDHHVIDRIVSALAPKNGQHLVEIGPGQGALTIPVLRQVKQLEAVELDRDLIKELNKRSERVGELKLYVADALTFDFAQLQTDQRSLRLFGNLPYNISTPLIFHLLSFATHIEDMLFMLQKEVAERLAAKVNDDAYGRLSVMAQYHCQIDLLFDVPPSAFFPPPKVQSSIIRLTPYSQLPSKANNYDIFYNVVKHAFGQRRKTLRNSLKEMISDEVWQRITISPTERAENLSVNDFVSISNALG